MTDANENDLNTLAQFLARKDAPTLPLVDLLVLLGSSLIVTAQVTADAWHSGSVGQILVSGGIGHSTPLLYQSVRQEPSLAEIPVQDRPEADILADILVLRHGVPRSKILIENRSTNCGSNAWECKRVLHDLGRTPQTVALIQDPTMQCRSHASFERAWRGEQSPNFISFAPFVPRVKNGQLIPAGQWPLERFMSLLLGEIPRLLDTGYGPLGADFIEHVEIPLEVLDAHERLTLAFHVGRN